MLASATAAALLVAAVPAGGLTTRGTVEMRTELAPNGLGRLAVEPGGSWRWDTCRRRVCSAFKHGYEIDTKGARPGSAFRIRGRGQFDLSPRWAGRVRSVAPPSVEGVVRVNELVRPVPGRWRGGWVGGKNRLQLAACVTADARQCTSLTDPHFINGCEHEAAVLEPAFAGQYLRVANRRFGPDPIREFAYAVSAPFGAAVWPRNRTTAVAIVGRIEAATGPRAAPCGAPEQFP